MFDDGKAEDIEVEPNGGAGAFQISQRIACQQKFRANHALDPDAAAFGAADQFVAHARRAYAADFFGAEVAQTAALHLVESDGNPHEHGRKRNHFYGGVPAVQVVRGIGFRDAYSLSAANRFFERQSFFDFG